MELPSGTVAMTPYDSEGVEGVAALAAGADAKTAALASSAPTREPTRPFLAERPRDRTCRPE